MKLSGKILLATLAVGFAVATVSFAQASDYSTVVSDPAQSAAVDSNVDQAVSIPTPSTTPVAPIRPEYPSNPDTVQPGTSVVSDSGLISTSYYVSPQSPARFLVVQEAQVAVTPTAHEALTGTFVLNSKNRVSFVPDQAEYLPNAADFDGYVVGFYYVHPKLDQDGSGFTYGGRHFGFNEKVDLSDLFSRFSSGTSYWNDSHWYLLHLRGGQYASDCAEFAMADHYVDEIATGNPGEPNIIIFNATPPQCVIDQFALPLSTRFVVEESALPALTLREENAIFRAGWTLTDWAVDYPWVRVVGVDPWNHKFTLDYDPQTGPEGEARLQALHELIRNHGMTVSLPGDSDYMSGFNGMEALAARILGH